MFAMSVVTVMSVIRVLSTGGGGGSFPPKRIASDNTRITFYAQ